VIDNGIADNAAKVGQYLMAGLNDLKDKYPFVTDVRGRGLLLAIEFDRDIGQDMLNACLENGMLVNRLKPDAIRLIPPLIIGNKEADQALGILDKALSTVKGDST
jgi:4-aminobutyrate aminotransferase-like enzyme